MNSESFNGDKRKVRLHKRNNRHYLNAMARNYMIRIRGKHAVPGSKSIDPAKSSCALDAGAREIRTIPDRFLQSCRHHANRTAVADVRGDLTYHSLHCQSSAIADAITRRAEFSPGDHVGLYLNNSLEYIAAFYGTMLAGGVAVPLPPYHRGERLQQLSELVELRLLVDSPSGNTTLDKLPFDCPENISLNDAQDASVTRITETDPDSLAMMLFTSGSTGDPKAVMLSHRNVLSNADSICRYLPIDSNDRILAIMPFAHALGNSVLQTHILSGAQLIFCDDLHFPAVLRDTLIERECTSLTGVPEVFESLLTAIEDSRNCFPHLRYMAVAGGRMDPSAATELASAIEPADLFIMYGQTEATARLSYLSPGELRENPDTIGRAIPGVELAIFDENGHTLPPAATGILHARGDNIMMGYWDDPAATHQVIQNGWLNTGDLARMDKNGLIRVGGRANGLIKIQGYRFHPMEVEQLVAGQLCGVQLVATPIEIRGRTRLALFAKSRSRQPIRRQDLQAVCRRLLPRHMMPHCYKVLDRWPLNSAGKVDRLALRNCLPADDQRTENEVHHLHSQAAR